MRLARVVATLGAISIITAAASCDAPRPDGIAGCATDLYEFKPSPHSSSAAARSGITGRPTPAFDVQPILPAAQPADIYQGLIAAIDSLGQQLGPPAPGQPRYFNILALSGGGQWGAYGAGFLNGWRAFDKVDANIANYRKNYGRPHQLRRDIHIVTGVSTGAAQGPLAYVGSTADERLAAAADARLTLEYTQVVQGDIIAGRPGGYLAALYSNSLYSVDGLERHAASIVDDYFGAMKNAPDHRRLFVGLTNLDRNAFVMADLKAMTDRASSTTERRQKACLTETLLGSAAVPLAFPPRFIDRNMYVDGSVRYGLFATQLLGDPRVRERLRAHRLTPYVSVIINGNQSADGYKATPPKEQKNSAIPIATKSVQIMVDQVYKDSAYRIENDLIAIFGASYVSRYTYIDNATIRESEFPACIRAKNDPVEREFDQQLMQCLHELGLRQGQDAMRPWLTFAQTPTTLAPKGR
ncbi:MAG: patatin-like phospholipase family protein [Alphaproteobacteria bacterium]|nr:patatin-like phospholipase family protein [Alphaproteobacteria bacterium]